ncbi:MAG: DUF7146 domain-containing protein, partial [Acetobacteraceae bacterium]
MSDAAPWRDAARRLLEDDGRSPWQTEFLRSILGRTVLTDRQAETLQRIADEPGAAEITRSLAERIDRLAVELVGDEPTHRGRIEWRFYPRGGLVVQVAGEHRGVWHDFASEKSGDALDLITHLRQCRVADAIQWARGWLGHPAREPAPPARPSHAAPPERDTLALPRRTWPEAADPAGGPAERYLAIRGLALPPDAPIRFHPACPRGTERLPAMLALMTDPVTAEPCGVHRTFLRPDGAGKIETGSAKMMLGRAGVVRLVPDTGVTFGLGLGEGIETALAIMQHAGWSPVWACASAGGIARFPVLGGIECITIFADRDDRGAGLKAAEACADRWIAAGREATIELPPGGTDWLNAL